MSSAIFHSPFSSHCFAAFTSDSTFCWLAVNGIFWAVVGVGNVVVDNVGVSVGGVGRVGAVG